jgi:hypothetical protein
VIEDVVARLAAQTAADAQPDSPKKRRNRTISLPLTARMVLAMTLMPAASCRKALTRLARHLPALPWARPWRVPSSTVRTD